MSVELEQVKESFFESCQLPLSGDVIWNGGDRRELLTHDFFTAGFPLFIILSRFNILEVFIKQTTRELKTGKSHGSRGLFDRRKGPVKIDRDAIRSVGDLRVLLDSISLGQLDKPVLGVTTPEIETICLEHQPFQPDDTPGMDLEELVNYQ
jgi:hypothetical protein